MTFVDRMGHRMSRYRFREGPPPLAPSFASNQGVCGLSRFDSEGVAYVCQTLNPKPYTLHPKPYTLHPKT